MPPAAACERCDFKVKTANEPAKPGEMNSLLNEIATHVGNNTASKAAAIVLYPEEYSSHFINLIYYETTPEEGFEEAIVAEACEK